MSIENSVQPLVETVAEKPKRVPTKNAETSEKRLVVDYAHLVESENGGTPILSYEVQWDQGQNVQSFDTL
jgi:hypothetical protein